MPKRSDRTSGDNREPEKPHRRPAHLDPDPDDVGDATDEEWEDADSRGITVSELRRRREKEAREMDDPFIPAESDGKMFKVRNAYPDHDPDGDGDHYWDGDEMTAGEALIIAADSVGMELTVEALGRRWLHLRGPDALIDAAHRFMELAKRRQPR